MVLPTRPGAAAPVPPLADAQVPAHGTSEFRQTDGVEATTSWEDIDEALANPSPWLTFPPELEARFETDAYRERLAVFMKSAQWTAPAIALFILSDHFMLPDIWGMAVVARLAGLAPYTLFAHMLGKLASSTRVLERAATVGIFTTASIHLALVVMSQSDLAQEYLTGVAMVIMYAAAFLRLRFKPGLVAIGFICAATLLAQALLPASERDLTIGVPVQVVVLSSAVFTLYALYFLEKEDRRNYLRMLKQGLIRRDLEHTISQIEDMARVDPLTQLPNRRQFGKQLDRMWGRLQIDQAAVSVLLIDVDHLARYNATHGARQGDACLHEVAQAIQGCLRRPNDIVARQDDDEFAVVLSDTGQEHARMVGERILSACRELHLQGDGRLVAPVTVSIGVACLGAASEFDATEALFAMARHALGTAKKQGGDQMMVSWSERSVV